MSWRKSVVAHGLGSGCTTDQAIRDELSDLVNRVESGEIDWLVLDRNARKMYGQAAIALEGSLPAATPRIARTIDEASERYHDRVIAEGEAALSSRQLSIERK